METQLEYILRKNLKPENIVFIEQHPELFEELVLLANSDKPLAYRATSLLWGCISDNDPRINPYIDNIVNNIHQKDVSHQRELLKLLLKINCKEEHIPLIFDLCVNMWLNNSQPSVRFTAFKMMMKLSIKYPELVNEISQLTQDKYMGNLSKTAQKSIIKMAKGRVL